MRNVDRLRERFERLTIFRHKKYNVNKKLKDKSILVKRLKCITFNISEEECFQMMIIMLKKMVMRVGNRS